MKSIIRFAFFALALLGVQFVLTSIASAANCNAAGGTCYWVGGTGAMDLATDSAHWSNTDNGASCSCEPSSTAILTFNANSCGGVTCTITAATGPFTIGGIDMGSCTGSTTGCIIDFATNNPNMTLSAVSFAFFNSGTGTRTLNCGTGTWTFTGVNGGLWYSNALTNATENCTGINFVVAPASTPTVTQTPTMQFSGTNNESFGSIRFTSTGTNTGPFTVRNGTTTTFANMYITGPINLTFYSGSALTITNAVSWAGTGTNPITLTFNGPGSTRPTITLAAGSTMNWMAFWEINFATAVTATNCFNLGGNTNLTCTAPTVGGGHIIGG